MTFKHVKFEDSPTMRALEKVAQEKGLVKSEPLQKTANKKLDTSLSDNLMENVFKLCAGLREKGFDKYASEIEVNLLNYKQAQTLYETSKEKGEDLVEFAHPQGSHKLEDVDSTEAVFEDILDQHKKILEKIQKKPAGKLASSEDVLDAVKVALGALPLDDKKVSLAASGLLFVKLMNMLKGVPELALPGTGGAAAAGGEAAGAVGAGAIAAAVAAALAAAIAGGYIGDALFSHYYEVTDLKEAGDRVLSEAKDIESDLSPKAYTYVNDLKDVLVQIQKLYPAIAATKESPTASNVADLKSLNDLIYQSRKLAGSLWSFAQSKKDEQLFGALRGFGDVVAAAANYMNVASKVNAAIEEFFTKAAQVAQQEAEKYFTSKPSAPTALPVDRLSALVGKLNGYKKNNYVAKNPTGVNFIDTEIQEVQTLMEQIKNIPANRAPAVATTVEQKVAEKEKEVSDFYNSWVKGRA